MKHIGWCLDQIQLVMGNMPGELDSEEKKTKATQVITQVQEYANTLTNIIHNPKFLNTLHQLKSAHIEGIRLQAQEVEELVKNLEHMLQVIDLTLTELREIITLDEKNIKRWRRSFDKLIIMIDQKFGGEMGELRREFQISLHTKEELQSIITSEQHLAEFLQ